MNPRRPMSAISRREVLGTLAASLAAPALLRAKGRGRRLPIAFSTLGCPGWTWPTVLDQADRLGYAGIELRGIQGDMDLTKRPELTGDGLKRTRRDLEARGIVVTDLGASAHMHEKGRRCGRPSSTRGAASSTSPTPLACPTCACSATRCRPTSRR